MARNRDLIADDIESTQAHNEREKEIYSNQDIVLEESHRNIHFKKPNASYTEMFDQLKKDGVIATRGQQADSIQYGELVFDVNSAYFYNHGGYEFAKQFYADAYKAAIEIVGGEQYILSATMHAGERNRAMSDALGEDVYHYHLHVVYIPVVEKLILWSKRCNCLLKKYYEDAKYNAAFVRCVDVMSQMLQKYGHQVLDKLEQDALQKVEHSEERNQAQPLTNKAA